MNKSSIYVRLGMVFVIGFLISASSVFALASVSPAVYDEISKSSTGTTDVVVYFKGAFTQYPNNQYISKQAFNRFLSSYGKSKLVESHYPDSVTLSASSRDVEFLRKQNFVSSIEYDLRFYTVLQDAVDITNAEDTWPLQLPNGPNLAGTGQTICLIDTGVNFSHPDLQHANIYGMNVDCSNGGCVANPNTEDLNGHGTYMAGIAAASGGINGIAPEINIISLKVTTGSGGSAGFTPIRNAINWCTQNRNFYNISVLSMSLSTNTTFSSYCNAEAGVSTLLVPAINNATSYNLSIVAATGNNGDPIGIGVPACISMVIPVGATNKDDTMAVYSNHNSMVQLFAPGSFINTTNRSGNYQVIHGTSASTPMVAAAIAMLNQVRTFTHGPRQLKPVDAEALLYYTGDEVIGYPQYSRINILNAILAMDSFVPSVSSSAPENNVIYRLPLQQTSMPVEFTCDAQDWALTNFSLTVIKQNQGVFAIEEREVSGSSYGETFVVDNLTRGRYYWYCSAVDSQGNTASSPSKTFNIIPTLQASSTQTPVGRIQEANATICPGGNC